MLCKYFDLGGGGRGQNFTVYYFTLGQSSDYCVVIILKYFIILKFDSFGETAMLSKTKRGQKPKYKLPD
jgi:hypothetical protein